MLTPKTLRALAGDRTYERGAEYLESNRVTRFEAKGAHINAVVRGTSNYRARLIVNAESIEFLCTCPVGDDEVFCKHLVAVALHWLRDKAVAGGSVEARDITSTKASVAQLKTPLRKRKRTPSNEPNVITVDDIRRYLEKLDKAELIGQLMQQAGHDAELMRRLILQVASATGNVEQGIATYKAGITAAFRVRDFVDYHSARAYANRIRQSLLPVEQLLQTPQAVSVIELTEHALKCLERAQGMVDDSDGHTVEIREWLHDMHFAACDCVRPDPKALARRLFARETGSELDVFDGSAHRYGDILGAEGLAVFRALATAEWKKLPVVKPGERNPNRYGSTAKITRIMESLANASGDVDQLVLVKQRDLSLPYDFVQIVEVYEQARRYESALEWAERGVKAFSGHTDHRLLKTLARQYARAERNDEAMALVWRVFTEHLVLAHYEQLYAFANPIQRWPEWRAKALAAIRQQLTTSQAAARTGYASANGSLLVDVFLWENTPDIAWQEAVTSGCSFDHWMRLARVRENEHPNDAVHVYQREAERVLQHADKRAYRDGAQLLHDVGRAMKRAGRHHEFATYLAQIRVANKARKNFLALLDTEFS